MASIRRTLSPVPRAGTLLNGEACSVASPLSKSPSCALHYPPSGGLLSSFFGSVDSQAFVLGFFSPKSSRSVERSKPKGHVWRTALFHFFICFVIGVFVGLTPFVSMTSSMSKNQVFSFEATSSTVGNFHSLVNITRNVVPQLETVSLDSNATLVTQVVKRALIDGISNESHDNRPFAPDSNVVYPKLLIIVTPTSASPFQAHYLNLLAHTLKLVPPPLLWIVVEMNSQSVETADILSKTGVMYRHLVCKKNLTDVKDMRVHQRNVALSHIETHHLDGIVYFADDDNIYTVDLFEQMRLIRRFGAWMVSKLTDNKGKAILHGPICNGTQVIGWHTSESILRFRRFHAEMSGFAFNSTILWDTKRWHRPTLEPIRQLDTVKERFQASSFIEQIVEDESQMEGLMHDCSIVMVWHLHLESSSSYPIEWFMKNNLNVIAPFT